MSEGTQEPRGRGFAIGLLAGTVVGAGLGLWLGTRLTADVRRRMRGSARVLVREAAERYLKTNARISDAVDEFTLNTRQRHADPARSPSKNPPPVV